MTQPTEENDILTENILQTEGKKYDAAVKKLLANKRILAKILKECVEEFKDCSLEDIEKKYIEGEPRIQSVGVMPDDSNIYKENAKPLIDGKNTEDSSVKEGKVTYDVLFDAYAPDGSGMIKLIINLEGQRNPDPGYPLIKRAIYYVSRLISAQHGREFVNSQYQKIKKVYSIWICLAPKEGKENTATTYKIQEETVLGNNKEKVENYDLMNIAIINIDKNTDDLNNNIIGFLSTILSDSLKAEEIIRILNEDFNIQTTKNMQKEVDNMCDLSKGLFLKGKAEGKAEEKLKTITTLMKTQNWTALQALKAVNTPQEEIPKYLALLG